MDGSLCHLHPWGGPAIRGQNPWAKRRLVYPRMAKPTRGLGKKNRQSAQSSPHRLSNCSGSRRETRKPTPQHRYPCVPVLNSQLSHGSFSGSRSHPTCPLTRSLANSPARPPCGLAPTPATPRSATPRRRSRRSKGSSSRSYRELRGVKTPRDVQVKSVRLLTSR